MLSLHLCKLRPATQHPGQPYWARPTCQPWPSLTHDTAVASPVLPLSVPQLPLYFFYLPYFSITYFFIVVMPTILTVRHGSLADFQFLAFKEAFKPISIATVPIYTSIYSGQLFLLSPYPFQCLLLFGSFVSMIAILMGMRQNFNVALIYIYLMVNDVEYFKNVISHSYFFFENSVPFHGQFLLCFLFS